MGAALKPSDIVASQKPIQTGPNGRVIQAGTVGIVVGRLSRKIEVQFEEGKNGTSEPIPCFRSNLRHLL